MAIGGASTGAGGKQDTTRGRRAKHGGKGIPDQQRAADLAAGAAGVLDLQAKLEFGAGLREPIPAGHPDHSYDPLEDAGGDVPLDEDGDVTEPETADGPWGLDDIQPDEARPPRWAQVIIRQDGADFSVTVRHPLGRTSKSQAERSDLLEAFVKVLAREQRLFLATEAPDDLQPLKQVQVAGATGWKPGAVSRLLSGPTWVELPSGDVVPLRDLLGDASAARVTLIGKLLRERELPLLGPDGEVDAKSLLGVETIAHEIDAAFPGWGNKASSIRRLMKDAGVPARRKERARAYAEGRDAWSCC